MTNNTETNKNPDEYNGWTNRETWAASLHLSNDFGLYEMVNGWANDARREAIEFSKGDTDMLERIGWTVEQGTVGRLAQLLQDYIETLRADIQDGSDISEPERMMVLEIGSDWRVDWRAVAAAWVDGFDFDQ